MQGKKIESEAWKLYIHNGFRDLQKDFIPEQHLQK